MSRKTRFYQLVRRVRIATYIGLHQFRLVGLTALVGSFGSPTEGPCINDPKPVLSDPATANLGDPAKFKVTVPLGTLSDEVHQFKVAHYPESIDRIEIIAEGFVSENKTIVRAIGIKPGVVPRIDIQTLPPNRPPTASDSIQKNSDTVYHTGDFNGDDFADVIGVNRGSWIYFQSGATRTGRWYSIKSEVFRPCNAQFVQEESNDDDPYLLLVSQAGDLKALNWHSTNSDTEIPFFLEPVEAQGDLNSSGVNIEYVTRGGKLIAISSCAELENKDLKLHHFITRYDLDDDGHLDRVDLVKNLYKNIGVDSDDSSKKDNLCPNESSTSCAYIQWGRLDNGNSEKQYFDIANPDLVTLGIFFDENLDLVFVKGNSIRFFKNLGNRKFEEAITHTKVVNYGYPNENISQLETGYFDHDGITDIAVLKEEPGLVTLLLSSESI